MYIQPSSTVRKYRKPSYFSTILLYSCFGLFFILFIGLGIWQIQRLHWKLQLIEQVNERIHRPPVPAPINHLQWSKLSFDQNEYQPVMLEGKYLNNKEVLVTTVRDEAGYWLMTPMVADSGQIIFVNRGFVPMDQANQFKRLKGLILGETKVVGLMRMSESNGFWFRKNRPNEHIWYSRQLPSMAESVDLDPSHVAPYFIDADATPVAGGVPQGGGTVVHFRNEHLSYAITWFSLATFVFLATAYTIWRRNKHDDDDFN